jgi:hypothetical protein
MKIRTLFSCALLVVLFVSTAKAEDLSTKRGYVAFTNLESVYGEPRVLINLNKTMLGFVSKLNMADPETSELIGNLEGIRVHIYDIDGNEQPALDVIASVSKDIQAKSWMPIVSINEENEKVRIFAKMTDDIMDGLMVMLVDNDDKGEAVFINIIGEIDPDKINSVTDSLNINIDL